MTSRNEVIAFMRINAASGCPAPRGGAAEVYNNSIRCDGVTGARACELCPLRKEAKGLPEAQQAS